MSQKIDILPPEQIQELIFLIRDNKVMLDFDLAKLYGVSTGRLNEQVKRNIKRFPKDFMFTLTLPEKNNLSQIAISSKKLKIIQDSQEPLLNMER